MHTNLESIASSTEPSAAAADEFSSRSLQHRMHLRTGQRYSKAAMLWLIVFLAGTLIFASSVALVVYTFATA